MAPFRRYHALRKRVLKLADYQVFDAFVPLIEHDEKYSDDAVRRVDRGGDGAAGPDYQARLRAAFTGRWIDVYENQGKRSGAYSAPVYRAHPYMLMNYNDTLDAVFTLAHELGHSMHTLLSHETQPFVYAGYTIFVAEVPRCSPRRCSSSICSTAPGRARSGRSSSSMRSTASSERSTTRCCSPTSS